MTAHNTTEQLLKTAQSIVEECMKQIEFLIKYSDDIKRESGGLVNLKKLDNFRDSISMVYITKQNKGILENVKLDTIFMFLDKGFFNETMLDMFVYTTSVKYNK